MLHSTQKPKVCCVRFQKQNFKQEVFFQVQQAIEKEEPKNFEQH
jgi:hypothetical protein